jgi:hypothetical protein
LSCTSNKKEIKKSNKCGCVYCLNVFDSKKVGKYCREKNGSLTGLCPICGIDSVVPDHTIKFSQEDLERWHNAGFGGY